jgi:hypothetical protein
MRDHDWLEQAAPADEFIQILREQFGAAKISAMLPNATLCVLCGEVSEFCGAFEMKANLRLYGLCFPCADLPDCIERVERTLAARESASIN